MEINRCNLVHIVAEQNIEAMELTEIQLKAARMTAMGISFGEIASELNINRTTIYRWRKLPPFSAEISRLVDAAKEENKDLVVRDISEIKDIVLTTLLDVAQYDDSGSARVSAARVLTEMVEKAESRSDKNNVMRDQSDEIKGLLQLIHNERSGVGSANL